MKKAVIAIVSAIYFVAIIIVAFLGVRAEISNETVLLDSIVLHDFDGEKAPEYEYTFLNPKNKKVYTVYKRPSDDKIKEDGTDENHILWNHSGEQYNYYVKLFNYEYVMDSDEWRDGKTHLDLKAKGYPENATKRGLSYFIQDAGEGSKLNTLVSVAENGVLTFKEKTDDIFRFVLDIKATDFSGISIKVYFVIASYY